MSQQVLRRRDQSSGAGLRAVLSAQENKSSPIAIPRPPEDPEIVKQQCDSFTFTTFTSHDAFELGHLLYARLLPFSTQLQTPTLISISLAASNQILFQVAVGSGTNPGNEIWVQAKRNTVCRFGTSSWFQHCKYAGDDEKFRGKYGLGMEAGKFAIHGGGVPIRVKGVEGVVAVVVVSGLEQWEDHGVIVDVIRENWEVVVE